MCSSAASRQLTCISSSEAKNPGYVQISARTLHLLALLVVSIPAPRCQYLTVSGPVAKTYGVRLAPASHGRLRTSRHWRLFAKFHTRVCRKKQFFEQRDQVSSTVVRLQEIPTYCIRVWHALPFFSSITGSDLVPLVCGYKAANTPKPIS